MSRSSLHLRLFLALSLVALLSSAASASLAVVTTSRLADEEARLRLLGAANVMADLLEVEKDRNLSDAAELAVRLASLGELEPASLQRAIVGSRQRIKDDYLVVVDRAGQVLAQDNVAPEVGGAAGGVVRVALAGRSTASLELRDSRLHLEGAAPIQREGEVVGAVIAGDLVDSRLLGRLKRNTGLEAALLGGERLLASTLKEPPAEVEQRLVSGLGAANTAGRLEAAEQVLVEEVRFGGIGYVGLLVPLGGEGGRTVSVLFLGLPISELSARQLDLLAPLLGLLALTLGTISSVSYLIARSLARRLAVAVRPDSGLRVVSDGLEIDRGRYSVRLRGRPVALTPTEFQLLWTLAEAPGRVFTRQELLHRVWGTDFVGDSGVVDTHIANLRRKLDDDPANPRYVLTVRGVGFKLREAG